MSNETDFMRPAGIDQGVLLNTNNEALENYKRAKKRLKTVSTLEIRVQSLEEKIDKLLDILGNKDG